MFKIQPSNYLSTDTVTRNFKCTTGGSNKFWNITKFGNTINLNYGAIGTKGQVLVKTFNRDASAALYMEEAVREKLNKGYYEVWAPKVSVVSAPVPPAVKLSHGQQVEEKLNKLLNELTDLVLKEHANLSWNTSRDLANRVSALVKLTK